MSPRPFIVSDAVNDRDGLIERSISPRAESGCVLILCRCCEIGIYVVNVRSKNAFWIAENSFLVLRFKGYYRLHPRPASDLA